jgi:V8-like Glu-specific endopeptidase
MPKVKKVQRQGVKKLHFWGEREKPMTPGELAARMPIAGTGTIPKELLKRSGSSVYVATSNKVKPTIEVREVGRRDGQTVWQIDTLENEDQRITQLLGKTAVREDPRKIRAAIDPKVDFTGHRPSWSDLFYIPRTLPRTSSGRLRRFDGRPVEPAYVFGTDDRQVYQDASYPWRCVGKVINNEGTVGSGALVGSNIVVTAAHMVPWRSVQANSWSMQFVPDFFDGQSLLGAGVQSYVSDVRGYDTSYFSGSPTGYDWAICKLYNPVGQSLGYFGFNGYSSDWENWNVWTVAGYPVGVAGGQRPSWQGGISILDDDGDSNDGQELESETADITGGNSGGPIWGWWNGDPRVIGVVSGWESEYRFLQGHQDNNIFASGPGICNLMAWGRSNW